MAVLPVGQTNGECIICVTAVAVLPIWFGACITCHKVMVVLPVRFEVGEVGVVAHVDHAVGALQQPFLLTGSSLVITSHTLAIHYNTNFTKQEIVIKLLVLRL